MMVNRNIILYSEVPLTVYLRILKQRTYKQKYFSYQPWIDESSKKFCMREFYGTIIGTNFKLVKIIYGKNFFTPVIYGQITNESKYTKVELFVKNSPYVKLACGCNFFICIVNIVLYLVTLDIVCVFSIIIAIMILMLFLILNNYHVNEFMKKINDSFSGDCPPDFHPPFSQT